MTRPTNDELNALKDQLGKLIAQSNTLIAKLGEHEKNYSNTITSINSSLEKAKSSTEGISLCETTAQERISNIEKLESSINEDYKKITQLASQVETISSKTKTEENVLEILTKRARELKDAIEGLLPGATSAGLASAFRERKESFNIPKNIWGGTFVLSMIAFLLVAFFDPLTLEKVTLNFDNVLPYTLSRLPFVIPIIWLAIYAGRRHSQALRLEEDYAHKEALSKSFEGYKTQLLEIEKDQDLPKSTLLLIERTLEALSLHPGRIYQGKHEDITPFHSLSSIFKRSRKNDEGSA